jgi:hypothetical protein
MWARASSGRRAMHAEQRSPRGRPRRPRVVDLDRDGGRGLGALAGADVRRDETGEPAPRLPKAPAFAVGTTRLGVPPKSREVALAASPRSRRSPRAARRRSTWTRRTRAGGRRPARRWRSSWWTRRCSRGRRTSSPTRSMHSTRNDRAARTRTRCASASSSGRRRSFTLQPRLGGGRDGRRRRIRWPRGGARARGDGEARRDARVPPSGARKRRLSWSDGHGDESREHLAARRLRRGSLPVGGLPAVGGCPSTSIRRAGELMMASIDAPK